MRYSFFLFCFCFCFLNSTCQLNTPNQQLSVLNVDEKMTGLSFVAPPKAFQTNPMPAVQAVAADWIAIIPFAYTRQGGNRVRYNESDWQWWGERPEGVETSIRLAKEAGIKVMLKPQVYVPGSWTGALSFEDKDNWEKWANSYRDYIMPFVEMADSLGVELFCIGTEFKALEVKKEQFWRDLIKDIRQKYKGKLTYAANWDAYEKVPFWDALDYIGIDAYFPLVDKKTPSVNELIKAWIPHEKTIKRYALEQQRAILFTEFGYLSVDGCAYNTWELESKIEQTRINEQAQANALEALFSTFWDKKYWGGGFIWKWFPNDKGHEGYLEKDYTPQGKKAEVVLKKWYSKTRIK